MNWSPWRPFPDPRKHGVLHAPLGPGVYDLRRASTKKPVLFGIGGRCALRMSSLLPKPHGAGTRNNEAKRKYVLKHLADIEYRTKPTKTRAEAAAIEREIKRTEGHLYIYNT
jgi:hypothetical protein